MSFNISKLGRLCGALSILASVLITSCQKSRLFVRPPVDPAPVLQLHFFNTFTADSSLAFTLNNAFRDNVFYGTFSKWYPFDSTQLSKVILVNNPLRPALNALTKVISLTANTSHLIFVASNTLTSLPYDLSPALEGSSRSRFVNAFTNLPISPELPLLYIEQPGTGRKLHTDLSTVVYPANANLNSRYVNKLLNKAGDKEITMTVGSTNYYFGSQSLPDGKGYIFIGYGNPTPGSKTPPKLLKMEEGKPETAVILEQKEIYTNTTADSLATLNFVHGSFILQELLPLPDLGAYTESVTGVSAVVNGKQVVRGLYFFQATLNLLLDAPQKDNKPEDVSVNRFLSATTAAGDARIEFLFGNAYNLPLSVPPLQVSLERGKAYTVATISRENRGDLLRVDAKIFPCERVPVLNRFRLRIMNLLAGSTVSVQRLTGEQILPPTPYKNASDYVEFDGSSAGQQLRLVVVGSDGGVQTQLANMLKTTTFNLSFTGSTTGTLYATGSIDARDQDRFPPTLDYRVDATYTPPNSFIKIPAILY